MSPAPATFVDTRNGVAATCRADVLALFQKLLPLEIFLAALKEAKVRENNRGLYQRRGGMADDLPAFARGGHAGERGSRVAWRVARQLLAAALQAIGTGRRRGRTAIVQANRSLQQSPAGAIAASGGTGLRSRLREVNRAG